MILAIPWTVACQAPLYIGFSRQEYWSGLPFPSPGYLSHPGIKPGSSALQEDSLPTELRGIVIGLWGFFFLYSFCIFHIFKKYQLLRKTTTKKVLLKRVGNSSSVAMKRKAVLCFEHGGFKTYSPRAE